MTAFHSQGRTLALKLSSAGAALRAAIVLAALTAVSSSVGRGGPDLRAVWRGRGGPVEVLGGDGRLRDARDTVEESDSPLEEEVEDEPEPELEEEAELEDGVEQDELGSWSGSRTSTMWLESGRTGSAGL
jgi:hypothetical protein